MTTQCYAMVRGSALRVTGLTKAGGLPAEIPYVATSSVTRVALNEVSEGGSNQTMRSEDGEIRLHMVTPAQPIKYTCDIEFIRTDPELLNLLTGVPVVTNASGDVVGFDARTKLNVATFGLEIWSRLTGQTCTGQLTDGAFGVGPFGFGPFGAAEDSETGRKWGYTLFPYLRGGRLSGFRFEAGLVSFSLVGAQVLRGSGWGVGPYDLTGPDTPLFVPIARNTRFRQIILPSQPPAQTDGISYVA